LGCLAAGGLCPAQGKSKIRKGCVVRRDPWKGILERRGLHHYKRRADLAWPQMCRGSQETEV
jgi:hypothetical protein